MNIPNYDSDGDSDNKFKQLYPYMPPDTFRMLICGNSGSGKTNLLCHMFSKTCYIYVCARNQRQLIDYFIQGRHKNCSVIYLSQSFYKTPKDVRLNCYHYCLYEFPSSRETNRISSELGVGEKHYKAATRDPYSFLFVDKPKKVIAKNFTGNISNS